MIIIFIAFCARKHQGVRSMILLVSTETDVRLHTYNWPSMTKGRLSISPRPYSQFITKKTLPWVEWQICLLRICSSNHKDFNLKSSFAYYKYTITQESESLSISAWYQWSFTFDHGTPISYNDLLLVFTIGA